MYSLPCKVDGQGAWDAELDLADSVNYVTEKVLDSMGFMHVSISDYGRKIVNDFNVEIHGVKFKADFVVLDLGLIIWITYFDFDKIEKSRKDTLPNPLIAEHEKRNKKNTITYSLQPVLNGNLKWKDLPFMERLTYYTLRNMTKLEYIYEGDGDVFIDYSWERALSINDEVYPEWVLEFFSTMCFDKDVDKSNLMTEKCIWFRLCENEHILTLLEFVVMLGLFMEDEVNHRLFGVHFDHREYWTKDGKPTLTNHKEVLVKEPLMWIVHKLIVGSLVHRLASRERCQKQDLWMMSTLEESRGVNLAWIITDHLYNHAPGTKESSVICAGHYVTKIASSLGYCVDDEIKKCLEMIYCEYWTTKMLVEELDENHHWGDWNASLNEVEHGNVWRDSMLIWNIYMLGHSMPILHHLANQGNIAYPTYEPPNVRPYPYPYIPYPQSYMHYPNPSNQSNQEGNYRLGGDDYFTSAMPEFGLSSLGYAVGGSSKGAGFDDEDMDE
uniref:Uncharacterized protein n=1 Tax=Tanacetum cinerariifolium TaxID=118510 RepID=A0A6L2M1C4_TANCI|nr:hypothetical protein [Tanacetum cinerariifolium]